MYVFVDHIAGLIFAIYFPTAKIRQKIYFYNFRSHVRVGKGEQNFFYDM